MPDPITFIIDHQGHQVQRQPDVNVFVRIGTAEYRIGTLTPPLPAAPGGPVNFQSAPLMSLTTAVNVTTNAERDLRGEVGELIFRLSFSPSEPPPDLSGATHTRIWIDNVRLGPVGTPLQAESAAQSDGTATAVNPDTLVTLLDASRVQWLGIVDAPDGIAGLSLGLVEVPTQVLGSASNTGEGGTGASEGGLDIQCLYTDMGIGFSPFNQQAGAMEVGLVGTTPAADQLGRDGEASLAADGHPIEPQENPRLVQAEQTGFSQAIMDKGSSVYAQIGEDRSLVGECAIAGIANDDIGRDFSTEGSEWTRADLELLNLEELALQPLIFLPLLLEGGRGR